MQITFLGAQLPLTKTITQRDGTFNVASFPNVSKLTSYHETASTLAQFRDLLITHAAQAHCLFNGQLTRPIQHESRASKTRKHTPQDWAVFDFDGVDASDHAEAVAKYLPEACQKVDYVVQYSSSMFMPDADQFSGHIFMLLKEPALQDTLRAWYETLNFTVPALKTALRLSPSGVALHWPLDRSAAYDSKLIYIAPPRCYGFEPAIAPEESIQLIRKGTKALTIPDFQPLSRGEIENEVNRQRVELGMQPQLFRTTPFEGGELLTGIEEGFISDVKPMGEHYLKFNLNGGDSMGYWIDLRNPAVIKNFKGEPWLLTKEVDKKFHKSLVQVAPKLLAKPAIEEGLEPLAFYATNQSSQIRIGSYSPLTDKLELNYANETAARAWLAEFGMLKAGYLPHKYLVYDPTSDLRYAAGDSQINTFQASKYMKQLRSDKEDSRLDNIPPVINKTLTSVLGNPTPEIYSHFINWMAYIFQTRKKTGTAWAFSGRTGTGKGTFVKYILTPLFGEDAVRTVQFGALHGEYNAFLEGSMFVVFEEADLKAVDNRHDLMSKLRHIITDSPIEIRKMRTDLYSAENYTNFIFMANERDGLVVTRDDRRLNITERQEERLFYTPNEMLVLQNGDELENFADVLLRWPVNETAATVDIIDTQARKDSHEATTSINQLIAEAILEGDLEFFIDRCPSDAEASADFYNRFNPVGLFRAQLDKYVAAAEAGQPVLLKDEDLFTMFRTLIPDTRYFQDSKTWRKRHYMQLGLDLSKQHRIPGDWDNRARGVLVEWKLPEGFVPTMVEDTNVVDIKAPKRKAK